MSTLSPSARSPTTPPTPTATPPSIAPPPPSIRACASRYGPVVLYDQDPEAHLQTEFGFDVLEVVQQRYAPEAFHDFIGFQVSKPVFERAFQDTYGLPLNLVLTKEDLAIGTYRRTVSTLLPKMTQVAVADFGKQMQQAEPTFVPKKLIYRMSQADYQKRFGNSYQRPGFGTRILAFFIKLIPKIGPLPRSLPPRPQRRCPEDLSFRHGHRG